MPDLLCYTVGHGTRPFDDFLALLNEHGIRRVVDVRTVPKSRHNPQYGQELLAGSLAGAGLEYRHLRGLGGLRKPRADSPNMGWRNESFRGYADYMLTPPFEEALETLVSWLADAPTAIMCAETVYWRCHRSLVADALLARQIPSIHVLGVGKCEPHRLTRLAVVQGTRVLYPPAEPELPFPPAGGEG